MNPSIHECGNRRTGSRDGVRTDTGGVIDHLGFLAEAAADLNSSLDLDRVFQKIARRVSELVDSHLFCVMLWNERKQVLAHSYSLKSGRHVVQEGEFALGEGLTGTAALERRPVRVGVLDLESLEPDSFTAEHERLLTALASHVATALENARLYGRLADSSTQEIADELIHVTDPLAETDVRPADDRTVLVLKAV
ncbi:MAG: hypothetical protein GY838_17410 [bacterium]|nr:hypothetical protein [bacterium]